MMEEYKIETTEPQDNEKVKILDERVRTWAIVIILDHILKLPQLSVDRSVRARFARAVTGGNTNPEIFNSNTYKYYNTLLDNAADPENLTKRQATERLTQMNQLIELFKDIRLHNSAIDEVIQMVENQKSAMEKYFAQ